MIKRSENFSWPGVVCDQYKNEPGTWQDVSRRVLFASEQSGFETRYFEVAAGGFTSLEKHKHEHCVLVMRGTGEVHLNGEWSKLQFGDLVHVSSMSPHQFRNRSSEPFGILCIVDRERDRPILLGNEGQD